MLTNLIAAIAISTGVPANLLLAVCWVETKHQHLINPDSGSASYGACQIKRSTALLVNKGASASDLTSERISVYYAALYLKRQLRRYDYNFACAAIAYNKGRASVDKARPICDNSYSRKVLAALERKPWLRN